MSNPLVNDGLLPDFGAVVPARVESALRELLDANRAGVAALLDGFVDVRLQLLVDFVVEAIAPEYVCDARPERHRSGHP